MVLAQLQQFDGEPDLASNGWRQAGCFVVDGICGDGCLPGQILRVRTLELRGILGYSALGQLANAS